MKSRPNTVKRLFAATCLFVLSSLLFILQPALAEKWPEKPIKIVVPTGPGSSVDRLTRGVQQYLSAEIGVPVVLANYPGGGFTVGTEHAWRQPADGHTLFSFAQPYFLSAIERMPNFKLEQVAFIGGLNIDPEGLVCNPKLGKFQTMDSILAALTKGETVLFGTTLGAPSLAGFYALNGQYGVPMPKIVLYRGGGEGRVDILGGHIDISTANRDGFLKSHQDGELKFIGFFSHSRLPDLPDVPTINEVLAARGFSGGTVPELKSFRFLAVNRQVKTDYPDRYQKLVSALQRVSQNGAFKAWAEQAGFKIQWVDPDECEQLTKDLKGLIDRYPMAFFEK